MSVYNGEAFLSQAIESILCQTFRDFEFLIIDDGSTDGTAEILSDYAKRDERIRGHRQGNRGVAEALNAGVGLATGTYIARMDADDVALPGRLEEQLEFLEGHPEVNLVGGAVEFINGQGEVIGSSRQPVEDSEIRAMMLRHNAFFHPTILVRRKAVADLGGYRKQLVDAEDYDLWLRAMERGRGANLGACVLRYRVHPDQVSVRNMQHQAICIAAARAAAVARSKGSPDPLLDMEEVNAEVLGTLGVSKKQIQETLADLYGFWMSVLGETEPGASLKVVDRLLELSRSGYLDRSATANAWLTAARLYYRQGRLGEAAVSACRAVLARPIIAGRPLKRAFTRVAAALGAKPQ